MTEQVIFNWTFKGFITTRGNIVQLWHDQQTEDIQIDFGFTLKTLRTRSPQEWGEMKMATKLKGKFDSLTELRFKTNRFPYRPVGFFGVGRQTFTILVIATKHDFDKECTRALNLRLLVEQNPGAYSDESDCLSEIVR